MSKRDYYITYTVDEHQSECITAETLPEAVKELRDRYLLSTVTVIDVEESEDEDGN
jgi:hypothetical protein